MAGSQATMAPRLTRRATQAAASVLAAVALATGALLGAAGAGPCADARCGTDSSWPASAASTTDRTASAPAPAIRSRLPWRAGGGPGSVSWCRSCSAVQRCSASSRLEMTVSRPAAWHSAMWAGRAATVPAATGPRKAAARASSDLAPALSRPNSSPNISWPAVAAISSAAAAGSSVGSVRGRAVPDRFPALSGTVLSAVVIAASSRLASSG